MLFNKEERRLAEAIGGTVSCSRAVVENGWQPQDLQVGQTGKTVRQLFVRPPQTAILLFCISFPWGWS